MNILELEKLEMKCPKLPDDYDPTKFLEDYIIKEASKMEEWIEETLKNNGYNYLFLFEGKTLKIFWKIITLAYYPYSPDYRIFVKGKNRSIGFSFREWLMPPINHFNCRCSIK